MSVLGKTFKGILNIAVIPFALVADCITLGGVLMDEDKSYTNNRISKACKEFKDAYDEIK